LCRYTELHCVALYNSGLWKSALSVFNFLRLNFSVNGGKPTIVAKHLDPLDNRNWSLPGYFSLEATPLLLQSDSYLLKTLLPPSAWSVLKPRFPSPRCCDHVLDPNDSRIRRRGLFTCIQPPFLPTRSRRHLRPQSRAHARRRGTPPQRIQTRRESAPRSRQTEATKQWREYKLHERPRLVSEQESRLFEHGHGSIEAGA